jgi:non-ribosomal peptide synthetase component E (peptide arylation enzyme)
VIRRSSENISAAEVEHFVKPQFVVLVAASVAIPDDVRGEGLKGLLLI